MAIQMGVNIEVIGTWLYRWVLMSQCKVYTNEITTLSKYILYTPLHIPLLLLGYLLFPMLPLLHKFVVSPTSLCSNCGHLQP